MKLPERILCFTIFMVIFSSCHQQSSESQPVKFVEYRSESSEIFFYYPDAQLTDSLKNLWGDDFFRKQDSAIADFSRLRHYADSLGIKHQSIDDSRFSILAEDGISVRFDTRKMPVPWGVLYLAKGKLPVKIQATASKNSILEILGFKPAAESSDIVTEIKHQQRKSLKRKRNLSRDSTPNRLPDSIASIISKLQAEVQFVMPADSLHYKGLESRLSGMNLIDQQAWFGIKMDNDIFNNTDVHYTNGVRFEYTSPFWQKSPLAWLLHPYQGKSVSYYGASLMQTMYTPLFPTWEGIQWGDRPFASYLYIGQYKVTHDPSRQIKLSTEIDFGVIGKSALGSTIQSYLHGAAKRPVGWNYQIKDDIVVNYTLQFEKGFLPADRHSLCMIGSLQAGTLFDNLSLGAKYQYSRYENFQPADLPEGDKQQSLKKILTYLGYHFYMQAETAAIGYDATLQGGMFNKSSPYTISDADVKRLVLRANAGFGFSFRRYYLGYTQYILSPEYKDQRWHKWGRVILIFGI
ncbi:MAG: lipid A deacylase LpxR family protein [Bacteroidales bacterium]|nr:lipid A deacylase LpxR family protein [Bacteroidales bacterium]